MSGAGSVCAKCGEHSTDAEFCSECGAAMAQMAGGAAQPELTSCPVCAEARPGPFARYCDTCRYDFLQRQAFSATPPAPPPESPAQIAPCWEMLVIVDLTLRRADDPMPADENDHVFPLDLPEQLIGRRSDSEDIRPEIVIADPGISRRHARIVRAKDGSLGVVDLGSMNGTRLNKVRLEPHVQMPLNADDELTLGCWTRLKLRAR